MPAATCLVGPSATFDAFAYVRALIEDTDSTQFLIPDSTLQTLVLKAVQDYSRYRPLDYQVGNPVNATSPFMTQSGVQRYVCNAGLGFVAVPYRITDVLYRAAATYSAANELAYITLLPFSPVNRFLFTPNLLDSPSERILRNQYLDELMHYGRGYAGIVRDPATGVSAIDLYPIPTGNPVPVFVRYQAVHQNSGTFANPVYATVPDELGWAFGDFLYACVLDLEADRLSKYGNAKAGLLQVQGDAQHLKEMAEITRYNAKAPLGAFQGVGITSY